MSSLARRSLRAAAAVAGIATAGVGIAGPAVAAPELPSRPSTDGVAPAPADGGSSANVIGDAPTTPQVSELPQVFTFEGPSIYTADQPLPERPAVGQTSERPGSEEVLGLLQQQKPFETTDVDVETASPQDRTGAMQDLDTASMIAEIAGHTNGATEGNQISR